MGKYTRLGEFLQSQRRKEIPMTFAEIERVIGAKLPPNSPQYPAWWSNNPSNNVMTKEWLRAGFRTEQVDVKARTVVFRRVEENRSETRPFQRARKGHPLFGALKGMVTGVDLTAPANPEWGQVVQAGEASGGFAEPATKPYATKDGRHPLFGALKDITHLVPGVDLTEPADPEWADLVDKKYGPEVR
jgi:hypothetical protein